MPCFGLLINLHLSYNMITLECCLACVSSLGSSWSRELSRRLSKCWQKRESDTLLCFFLSGYAYGTYRRLKTIFLGFICQSIISWLMLIPDSTTFEVLLNYFTFFGWLGYGASISSILWLRYKRPNAVRPYKVKILWEILLLSLRVYWTLYFVRN